MEDADKEKLARLGSFLEDLIGLIRTSGNHGFCRTNPRDSNLGDAYRKFVTLKNKWKSDLSPLGVDDGLWSDYHVFLNTVEDRGVYNGMIKRWFLTCMPEITPELQPRISFRECIEGVYDVILIRGGAAKGISREIIVELQAYFTMNGMNNYFQLV